MKYSKEAKTCEQQADLLLDRGLVANKEHPVAVLSQINYYRLSTYLYTYRDKKTNEDTHTCLWNWQHDIPVKIPTPRKYPKWNMIFVSEKEKTK